MPARNIQDIVEGRGTLKGMHLMEGALQPDASRCAHLQLIGCDIGHAAVGRQQASKSLKQ